MRPRSSYPTTRRRPRSRAPCLLALCLLASGARGLRAEVVLEESYTLAAGWNLIHVPVEPLDKDARIALAAVDWVSLWTWLPEAVPGAAPGRGGRWLVLRRNEPVFLNTLGSFSGPASYALLAGSAGTLRLKGYLRPDRQPLRGGAFQLFGPGVPASSPPSLAGYLSRPGVLEQVGAVHGITGGAYRRLSPGDSLSRGAAYWVRPAQEVPEPNPLRVGAGFGGLQFSAQVTLQEIEIDLGAAAGGGGGGGIEAPRRLNLRTIPSAGGAHPADWLELQEPDGTFAPLSAGAAIDIDPQATRARIALRARQEGVAAPDAADKALAIEITAPAGSALVGADLDLSTLEGIWTGEASLSEVERPSFHGGGHAPAAALPVSIILEVPDAGRPRLLPCLQVEADRDGRKITYRLEAALFHQAVELQGSIDARGTSGVLSGSLSLPAGHPLNPYRHRYHLEHGQGYGITRSLQLRFGAQGPVQGPESPFATVGVLEGVYEEEVGGLAQEPIRVRGSFRLRRLAGGAGAPCASPGQ